MFIFSTLSSCPKLKRSWMVRMRCSFHMCNRLKIGFMHWNNMLLIKRNDCKMWNIPNLSHHHPHHLPHLPHLLLNQT